MLVVANAVTAYSARIVMFSVVGWVPERSDSAARRSYSNVFSRVCLWVHGCVCHQRALSLLNRSRYHHEIFTEATYMVKS